VRNSIACHNGAQDPSWSSGINTYEASGTNIIDGNVSFENIDVSSHASDGSGFILDFGSTHGLFVNNIAFRNGGSCIRLTNSSGGELVNNTCVLNG
jgi:parallel beta-helix repeat protein